MKENLQAIMTAITKDDVATIRELIGKHPDLIKYDPGPGSWLHFAARRSKTSAMVKALVELGCDVNAERMDVRTRDTPLFCAFAQDNLEMVQALLEHGADPNFKDQRHIISAITGVSQHSLEYVKLLDKHGVDLHRVYMNEITHVPMNALSAAIDWGKEDVVAYLKSKGAVLPNALPKQAKDKGKK